MRTSQKTPGTIITIGLDLGKNTFHLVGLDKRGGSRRYPAAARTPFRQYPPLPDRHGGLLGLSPYRPPVGGAWSRRASDPGPETVPPRVTRTTIRDAEAIAPFHQHRDRPLQRTSLKPNPRLVQPPARPASGCLRIAFLGAGLFSSADPWRPPSQGAV
jgi:hypothetical protein